MKKIILSICMAVVIFSFSGCSDFLDRKAYGSDDSSVWKSEDDVMKGIYALYHFASPYWSESILGRGHMWFECASDNILIGRDRPAVDEIREFKMSPANDQDIRRLWEVMYQNVAKSNSIIRIVPEMNLDQKFKNKATGAGYFFRGFSMLWMVPYYGDDTNGGIPIITDLTPPIEMDSPRPTHVLQNYEQIISDMRTAGDLLPYYSELQATEIGLPHKAAAWGFGARAALYASMYDSKYLDVVIEFCDKIINMTGPDKRSLYVDGSNKANSYANLFTKAQNHGPEYIFSIEGDITNGARYHGVTFVNGGWGYYNTWGYFTPSKELYDAYETGDTRRGVTILHPGDYIKFIGQNIHFGGFKSGSIEGWHFTGHKSAGLICRKFISPWTESDCVGKEVASQRDKLWNTLNLTLLRYADVMLMKAEALIWKFGEGNAEAKTLIDDIRDRAGLPKNSNATKTQLQNERRCELAFEFMPSRHIDLVRWGLAKEYYAQPLHSVEPVFTGKDLTAVNTIKVYEGRNFNPTYHKVFPIPQSAFNGNKFLKQNKGY